MSREIDLEEPLSDEDRQYLLDRGRDDLVRQNDLEFGDEESEARPLSPFGEPMARSMTGDVGFDEENTSTRPTLVDRTVQQTVKGQGTSGAGNALVGDADTDEDDEEDSEDDVPPYSEWSNEELREQLKGRGLSAGGPKAELVARLEEDDAKQE